MRRGALVGLLGICVCAGMAGCPTRAAPPDAGPWAAIDQWAVDAPPSAERSPESLAAYLTRPAKSEAEKARALFRWTAEKIAYDVPGARSGTAADLVAEDVLRRRASVCSGYAALFERLARLAGLEAVTVGGLGKGYGFAAGSPLPQRSNHAWNAVKVDGRWHLLDATWGAGYQGESGKFVRRFAGHYFLTPPDQFVFDHLPENPRWQLLDRPVSRAEYEQMVYLRPAFFGTGLGVLSHSGAAIRAGESLRVDLSGSADVALMAKVMRGATSLDETLALAQWEKDRFTVRAAFPSAGTYVLRVFVKRRGEPGAYAWAVDYQVEASAGRTDSPGFPRTTSGFLDRGATVVAPLAGRLKAGAAQEFSLVVPGADSVAVFTGGRPIHLGKTGGRFEGSVTPSAGDVQVCVRTAPGSTRYEGLLMYKAE